MDDAESFIEGDTSQDSICEKPVYNSWDQFYDFLWVIDLDIYGPLQDDLPIADWKYCTVNIGEFDLGMLKRFLEKSTPAFMRCIPDQAFDELIARFTKGTHKNLFNHAYLSCRINSYGSKDYIIYPYNKGINLHIDRQISEILESIYTFLKKLEAHYKKQGFLLHIPEKVDQVSFPFNYTFAEQSITDAFNFLYKKGYVDLDSKQSFIDLFQCKSVDQNKRINWKKGRVVLADFIRALGGFLPVNTDYFVIARSYFTFKQEELKDQFHNYANRRSAGMHRDAKILLQHLTDTED